MNRSSESDERSAACKSSRHEHDPGRVPPGRLARERRDAAPHAKARFVTGRHGSCRDARQTLPELRHEPRDDRRRIAEHARERRIVHARSERRQNPEPRKIRRSAARLPAAPPMHGEPGAASASAAAASATRVLPIPGSPASKRHRPRPAFTSESARSTSASSRARPTSRAWSLGYRNVGAANRHGGILRKCCDTNVSFPERFDSFAQPRSRGHTCSTCEPMPVIRTLRGTHFHEPRARKAAVESHMKTRITAETATIALLAVMTGCGSGETPNGQNSGGTPGAGTTGASGGNGATGVGGTKRPARPPAARAASRRRAEPHRRRGNGGATPGSAREARPKVAWADWARQGGAGAVGGAAGSGAGGGTATAAFTVKSQLASQVMSSAPTTVGIVTWSVDVRALTAAPIDFGLTTELRHARAGGSRARRLSHAAARHEAGEHVSLSHRRDARGGTKYASNDYTITDGSGDRLPVSVSALREVSATARKRGFIVTSYWKGTGSAVPFILDADGDDRLVGNERSERRHRARRHVGRRQEHVDDYGEQHAAAALMRVSMDGSNARRTRAPSARTTSRRSPARRWRSSNTARATATASSRSIRAARRARSGNRRASSTASGCHGNALRYSQAENVYTFSDVRQDIFVVSRAGAAAMAPVRAHHGRQRAWGGTQHGHHLLDASILVFANRRRRPGGLRLHRIQPRRASRCSATPGGGFSANLGDVQRLPGGNTLITYSNDSSIQGDRRAAKRRARDRRWQVALRLRALARDALRSAAGHLAIATRAALGRHLSLTGARK